MASPRIVYNGVTLDFPELLSMYDLSDDSHANAFTADGGVTETVRSGWWETLEIAVERFESTSFFRGLTAWWAWACRGKQYSFAVDSARVVNTTLVNNEAAGATVIELTSTTGVTAGQEYLIRSADLIKWEKVVPSSVSPGVSMTIPAPGLIYAYSAGELCRDPLYFPKVVSADRKVPFGEIAFSGYELRHKMIEDRG